MARGKHLSRHTDSRSSYYHDQTLEEAYNAIRARKPHKSQSKNVDRFQEVDKYRRQAMRDENKYFRDDKKGLHDRDPDYGDYDHDDYNDYRKQKINHNKKVKTNQTKKTKTCKCKRSRK